VNDGYNEAIQNITINIELPSSSVPLIIIMVDWLDDRIFNSDLIWHDKIFGYTDGQLNHYFKENSNSKFSLKEARETYGTSNDGADYYDATIGIIAHELGHALFDLPDLYA
jgi:hypothetical protein